ncbi:hypothetical protein F2Q69_00026805 [Brassica cretica]|uniref:Uncharacterized protein n=1 Tax=Brassica cretica TaxID=69181 RepID=A0A8S9SA69_BRACR|nr:hypothetical protein F2Q69_00026805 [Brassica cretica]
MPTDPNTHQTRSAQSHENRLPLTQHHRHSRVVLGAGDDGANTATVSQKTKAGGRRAERASTPRKLQLNSRAVCRFD